MVALRTVNHRDERLKGTIMTLERTNKMSKALSELHTSALTERESAIIAAVRELMVPLSRGLEDHTPIIITDGSASIEFAEI